MTLTDRRKLTLTRSQAEELIGTAAVLSSRLEQTPRQISVRMELEGRKRLVFTYDRCSREKSYYVEESGA